MTSEEMYFDGKRPSNTPTVAILMATYNGERFLIEQLESFADQTQKDWVLWVSDDGSSDKTIDILKKFSKRFPAGKVNVIEGPKSGFAKNFLSLVANPKVIAKNYAYADQDDVWFVDKLERALGCLNKYPDSIPSLYCSRTEYVDESMAHIGYSAEYKRPPTFLNALVQNIASGNTMVFNGATRKLMAKASQVDVPLHDWWTYIVVAGCNGMVFFDRKPTVHYRQHAGNLWGMNVGWSNRLSRIQKLFEGRFKGWNAQHIFALQTVCDKLAPEAMIDLQRFSLIRNSSFALRLYFLKVSGLYRQTFLGNLGLWVAVAFGKI